MYLLGTQSPITILNAITINAFKKFLSNLKWMIQFFHFNHFIDIVWKLIGIMGKAKGQLTIWDAWKKNVVLSMPLAKTFVVGEVVVEVSLVQLKKLFLHFCIVFLLVKCWVWIFRNGCLFNLSMCIFKSHGKFKELQNIKENKLWCRWLRF